MEESPKLFRGLGVVDSKAYAVGMGYQVYRRDNDSLWVPMRKGLPETNGALLGFESLAGFHHNDLYAAGWEGEIWHWKGKQWEKEDIPTNFILSSMCCTSDGSVYACGRHGTVINGRAGNWRMINDEGFVEDLRSIVEYKRAVYLCSMRSLFKLVNDEIEEVAVSIDKHETWPLTFGHLSVAEDILCSVGERDILLFDGLKWMRLDAE